MQPWRQHLNVGQVIPACPLALHADGSWAVRHQRALLRYYIESGAGGLAVGVHSTQFAIRSPDHGLFEPLLQQVAIWLNEEIPDSQPFVRIAGICGETEQAVNEAEFASQNAYHAGLLSLGALAHASESRLLDHCRIVSESIPIIGFYLQPAVGGRLLPYSFWRRLAEIQNVVAVKIAPFNRYQTIDVVRAIVDSGRQDIALYTGNDDNIIADLLTPFTFGDETRFIVGGLLGQWGVWTHAAVQLLRELQTARRGESIDRSWLTRNAALTDANAAIFDAGNQFAGCIPGIHEVLRRQGLLPSARCLDPTETLSDGQSAELDRVSIAYPELTDDRFIEANLHRWLDT